jgi:hypothetical protein
MGPSCGRKRLSLLPAYPLSITVCRHPSHASRDLDYLALSPVPAASPHATMRGAYAPLPQGSSAPVQVMLSRSIPAYTTPCASPTGTLRFRGIALIRSAFAVRERLGNPRDLPYFCCCSFHACHRPYSGGPLTSFVPLTQSAVPDFLDLGTSRQPANTVSASNIRRVFDFGAASIRFMLRPACLPSPPDWLRQDEVTCSSPRLLRYIVTPALDAVCYQTTLGVRLNGRTGNLPLSGLSPNQLSAASEAAPKNAKLKEVFLGGLCAFARDNPRLTGARSAPYEKPSCPSRLRGESYFSHFGCGVAALGASW